MSVFHCESIEQELCTMFAHHRDERVHELESRLAEVSEEASKDRELRKEAEANAQTYKEQYASREEEIGDLQTDLERARAALKKSSEDLVIRVKAKEQELYDKKFQMCNMEVGMYLLEVLWVWVCCCHCVLKDGIK